MTARLPRSVAAVARRHDALACATIADGHVLIVDRRGAATHAGVAAIVGGDAGDVLVRWHGTHLAFDARHGRHVAGPCAWLSLATAAERAAWRANPGAPIDARRAR